MRVKSERSKHTSREASQCKSTATLASWGCPTPILAACQPLTHASPSSLPLRVPGLLVVALDVGLEPGILLVQDVENARRGILEDLVDHLRRAKPTVSRSLHDVKQLPNPPCPGPILPSCPSLTEIFCLSASCASLYLWRHDFSLGGRLTAQNRRRRLATGSSSVLGRTQHGTYSSLRSCTRLGNRTGLGICLGTGSSSRGPGTGTVHCRVCRGEAWYESNPTRRNSVVETLTRNVSRTGD